MEIILSKLKIIKTEIKTLIFFTACFIAGLLIGLIFKENCFNPSLYNSATAYYTCIFDVYCSVFSIFAKRIFAAFLMFSAVFLLSLNKMSAYFSVFIFFLRGLILGMALNVFWMSYSVSGVFVFVFVVFIQNIIVTAGMIFVVILNLRQCDKPIACRINDLIFNFALSFGVCLAGALYELIILTFILRPIVLWF